MTNAEDRQKTAMIMLEYQEAKQTFSLLQVDARQIADDLEGLAKSLRDDPGRIVNPEGRLPTYKQIFELAQKITKVTQDLTQRQDLLRSVGFDV